jgi:hypothetical protein
MKPKDLGDARQIAQLLEEGTVTRRDLIAFLIYIREHISEGMVKDIAHFVAHANRNRGYAFTYTEGFVKHMVGVFNDGGLLEVKPIFEITALIKELCQDALSLDIAIDQSKLEGHRQEFEAALVDLLDGVSLKLQNPDVESCMFQQVTDKGNELLVVVVETKGLPSGVIRVPANVKLAFPVF